MRVAELSPYSIPTALERQTAKEIICDILAVAGGSDGEFYGETRLYKVFYYAHLAYYRLYPGVLSS